MANKGWQTEGYKYLKTGDPIGRLCYECGSEMYIEKTKKTGWLIRCPCGRVVPFVADQDNDYKTWA